MARDALLFNNIFKYSLKLISQKYFENKKQFTLAVGRNRSCHGEAEAATSPGAHRSED